MKQIDKFRWGVSTSAFQIEGANQEDGKGLSTLDVRQVKQGIADTSIAADFYHQWQNDIPLLKKLGVTSLRLSFSWSRIIPTGDGRVNAKGLAFYDHVVNALLAQGIEPIVTINHFDMPAALITKYNGWLNRNAVVDFEKYAIVLFKHFGDRVKMWLTINEPLMLMYNPAFNGSHYSQPEKSTSANFLILHHILLAEKRAFLRCHELVESGQIGPVSSFENVYPLSTDPKDVSAAMTAESVMSYWALDVAVRGHYPLDTYTKLNRLGLAPHVSDQDQKIFESDYPDFVAFNYYSSVRAGAYHKPTGKVIPFFDSPLYTVEMGPQRKTTKWAAMTADPEGMAISARKLYARYGLPLLITENGYADTLEPNNQGEINDDDRIEYLNAHAQKCLELIHDQIPLKGYFVWSFMDSLSGREGFTKRYGLVFVNRTDTDLRDLARIPKKSFYWYQNFIREQEENR